MSEATDRLKMRNPWHLLATGFGSGLSPIVPGTMGSLAAIPFWLLMARMPIWSCWVIIVAGFFIGCLICQRTSDDMKVHDHGSIVWDEFIGMWITLMAIPTVSWEWILTGFFIFRIFDMWKPWPIRWFDRRVSGGFGIMIDDVIAAIFAYVMVWLLAFYNLMPFSAN
ncbi:phosphatidylglycerophosphatase A [Moellerella wisconsensis]|uniref:Phosphatidylglycerophosphatase A n=2 Tax=Moellerella wisconsensis TaxID=158849 RepID=A0ACD3Y6B1_9GAMM|nr:phosphatidylglycerophosphatase A [Moellerella wisconsensis]KLN96471.1 phosphatidylglycerophosphatase [Moellerella wisconsensis]UNH23703.1 phosphatidylglycerophosphatase A [Moellerella wisconsensis]UNH26791.1 phosphatidylglycerophosphatase A [Moellerella wisconsensis]UNH30275.1 phosphatidylglycerophosphatase A [Moellerella wisconsensis]UNH38434.1 phosphatidylglycerophosphatase A [Moellerella wisconsensis]